MSELNAYLRQTYALTSRELKHWYRSKTQMAMALIMPLMWLGLFGFAMSGFIDMSGLDVDYFSYLAMGMVIITSLSTSMNAGMSVIWDRRFGFLAKLKAAPIPRGVIPLSKVLATTFKATIQSMLILLIGLFLGLNLIEGFGIVELLVIIVAVEAVALTFSSIFVALGLVIKNQEVLMSVNMLLNLPLMFASGAMFPTSTFPGWLKVVANVNPLTYAADAIRRASIPLNDSMLSVPEMSLGQDVVLIVLAAIVVTALGMFFARRGLRE
jgi:ABC-2 type transport system permease protein